MTVVIVPNPDYVGPPRLLTPVCHDRTPFLTFQGDCGHLGHLHESQLVGFPRDAVLVARCAECRREMEIEVADLRDGFAQMRSDGWIR